MSEPLQLQATHETVGATGRVRLDAYFTPERLAQEAVGWLVRDGYLWAGANILEPSAGRGAWLQAVKSLAAVVNANDIDPARVAELQQAYPGVHVTNDDFLTCDDWGPHFDTVLGNPPFAGAEEHVRKALSLRARHGAVAFLLRLAFLESKERVPFWRAHPASKIYVLSERPSFSGGGTDNSAYGFFVWASWHRGPTELEVMSWK